MFAYYKVGILIALSAFYFRFINSEGIGSECFINSDCGYSNIFVCDYNKCICDQRHIPDRENKWCVVGISKECYEYRDICYDLNAECQDPKAPNYGTCKCKTGFTLHPLKQICSVIIGNKCNVTQDCTDGTCSNEVCLCTSPLQPNINASKCLPALHNDCSSFNECATENAICNSKCECAETFKEAQRENGVFCLTMLGNMCKNKTECADEGADCIALNQTEKVSGKNEPDLNRTCECSSGYVQNPKVSECLKVATELQAPCKEDIQCTKYSGFGSECRNSKCECKKGFYFDVDFDRCVRSCLCDGVSKDINDIKSLMKDLKPFIETMAKTNNVDASRLLRKINKL